MRSDEKQNLQTQKRGSLIPFQAVVQVAADIYLRLDLALIFRAFVFPEVFAFCFLATLFFLVAFLADAFLATLFFAAPLFLFMASS